MIRMVILKVFPKQSRRIVEQDRDKELSSLPAGQREEEEILRRTDTRLIVVPNVHTLLWGTFSIFPVLLPFYPPGAALVAACK
jgi:hypothetical protein